jgi:catalase
MGSAIEIAPDKQTLYEEVVDALNTLFGHHLGYRPVHAKGILCKGVFRPDAAAASVSRAAHFEGQSVPITVRFSDFAGIPTVPDGDPNASPRGMAIRFHLPDGADTDIVAHSYNGFPARTVEEFLEFARALAASGPETPEPKPIVAFLADHPAARAFAEAPKPAPTSFAKESYHAVNAFRFIGRDGASRCGRYHIRPLDGEEHLSPADAARRPPGFLFQDLERRLAEGGAAFRLFLQMPAPGDQTSDGSLPWPDDRPQVELGVVEVTRLVPDSKAVERELVFDPARLTDGIEFSDDSMPLARSAIYAISYRRRKPLSRSERA